MIHTHDANCQFCAHYQGGQRCQAFPAGIPAIFWSGENLHRAPYPGDGGFQYERKQIELSDPRKLGVNTTDAPPADRRAA